MAERLDKTSLAGAKVAFIYEGWIGRTHDESHPLVYGGGQEEYRDAEELDNVLRQVQRCASFKSPELIPATLLHPETLLRFGAEGHIVGRILDGRLDEDHVVARILIDDPQAVAAIDAGTHELSMGYTADLGEDRYQRNIVMDHLAIVPAGRCGTCELNPVRADGCEVAYRRDLGGPLVRVGTELARSNQTANLDSPMKVGALTVDLGLKLDDESRETLARLEKLGITMGDLKAKTDCGCSTVEHAEPACSTCKIQANLLNKESHVMDELKKQLEDALKALEAEKATNATLQSELTAAKSDAEKAKTDAELANEKTDLKVAAVKADVERLTAELEEAKTKLAAAESAKADAEGENFTKRVDARVALLDAAQKAGIEGAREKADKTIKVEICEKVTGKVMKADASDGYIEARFEMAMDLLSESVKSVTEVRGAIKDHEDTAKATSTTNLDEEAEREASIKRREERFAGKKKD